jgi:hypothetical protein
MFPITGPCVAGPSRACKRLARAPTLCQSRPPISGDRSFSSAPIVRTPQATPSSPSPASHAYIHPSASLPFAPSSAVAAALASPATSPLSLEPEADTASASASAGSAQTHAPLTDAQRELIHRIVRVDQAGELGANWIYRGQKWGSGVRGDGRTVKDVEVGLRSLSMPTPLASMCCRDCRSLPHHLADAALGDVAK